MGDSDYPIKKSGSFGEHVCITMREKSVEKLQPRYAGQFNEKCAIFPSYKFDSVETAITAYLTSIFAYINDM